jgi:hypothetical protein
LYLLKNGMRGYALDSADSGYGPMAFYYEYVNESSGSIKCWEVIQWLNNYGFYNFSNVLYAVDIMLKHFGYTYASSACSWAQ